MSFMVLSGRPAGGRREREREREREEEEEEEEEDHEVSTLD